MREIKFRFWYKGGLNGNKLVYWPDDKIDLEIYLTGEHPAMQFTGLHDKNGKDIYEGDVVLIDGSKIPAVMEFNKGAFLVANIYGGHEAYRMEIIGNIYENPELLK